MQSKTTKSNDTPDTSDPRNYFFLFPCYCQEVKDREMES